MHSIPAAHRRLFAASTLVFAASVAATLATGASMSGMHAMPMPGGWSMSMAWMRMPGQGWAGFAASFLGMWLVMMMAMMLPSLLPMLRRYRDALGGGMGAARSDRLTVLVGAAYFVVWTACGVAALALGIVATTLAMRSPAAARCVPLAIGAVVTIAGVLQFSRWKAHHLACCRTASACACTLAADARGAWRHGLRLGLHCCHCCAGTTAVLLVAGVMDLRAMALVTAAITAERLAPSGERVARAIGVVLVAAGACLLANAIGLA